MNLVIVESPTKAKTITRYLPKDFKVVPSYGHIRDLPKAELGVDIENNYKPRYIIPRKSQKHVTTLKKEVEKIPDVILATDSDREGEAIAWHLTQLLKLDPEKTKRIVFHEITKKAIEEALKNPRKIDMNLVNAQQARRILDRLVGYKLSPFLWKKVRSGLSAGRVQSVALRLICDREKEIQEFKPQEYWTITAFLTKLKNKGRIEAILFKKDGKTLPKLAIKSKKEAGEIVKDLSKATFKIIDIQSKETKKAPPPPFVTSSLQQTAANKLGFSAKKTMLLAQQLYEGIEIEKKSTGLITYMRTDSTNLAQDALSEIKTVIEQKFGSKYSLEKPRVYKTKSRLAQEAHEAIRPTSIFRFPDDVKAYLNRDQFQLYDLIWKRTLACQMREAVLNTQTCDIQAKNYTFRAKGTQVKFDGFTKIYGQNYFKENLLPELEINEILKLLKLTPKQHFTQPPPRYTEATLIKTLEEFGIGRPSTYAPIIFIIQERGYVKKVERKFHPTEIGLSVNKLLTTHFPKIVDINFTAKMEDDLDKIAQAKANWTSVIDNFYRPFAKHLAEKEKAVRDKIEKKTQKKCPKCGETLIIKEGRYGKFLACSNFPKCKYTEPYGKEREEIKTDKKCPECNSPLVIKEGRYGKFYACTGYPKCKYTKPFTNSTGIQCPKCKKGEIVERRTKKNKIFYSCNRYPKCDFALWQKPQGELCPKCQNLLIYTKDNKVKCSNKNCDFEKIKAESRTKSE